MVTTRFGQIQADAFLGSALDNSPFGKVWYVDGTNGSNGNAGDAPDQAFSTIAMAISAAVATRGDTVSIAPGTYTVTAALSPKAYMTFKASTVNPQAPAVSIRGNLATLMNVDVNGCRFIGIEFRAAGTTTRDLVRLADTTAITGGVLFEDCVFHGADTITGVDGVAGLWLADPSNSVTGLIIRRCLFRDLGKSCVDVGASGMPYAKIEDNVFAIDTGSGIGIAMGDTLAYATGKGYTIKQNEFIGPSATTTTTVGIVIVGTANTTGAGIIRNNFFSYCATAAITANKFQSSIINNYNGEGAGGTLVSN